MSSDQSTSSHHTRFEQYLRKGGKRCTPERFAILSLMLTAKGRLCAKQVLSKMNESGYPVSIATVYATLDLLVACGLVVRRRLSDSSWYYQMAEGSTGQLQLVCSGCGKVKDVRDPMITALIDSARYTGFTQSSYTLTVYGTCGACKRKRARTKRKQSVNNK